MEDKINDIRQKIDEIDDNILGLLVKRINLAKTIGNIKNKTGSSIYRPEREQSIIQRLSKGDTGLLNADSIRNIFLEIFSVSRSIESSDRVGYLGPEGSFTHQAAKEHLGGTGIFVPIKNINSIFKAVEEKHIRFGVIPIENNQEGTVNESLKNLYRSNVKIIGEVIIPIDMVLASQQESINKLTKIYSKDIAFRQCQNFFIDFFIEHIPKVAVTSTSNAANLSLNDVNSAAICSKISAQLLNLPILFENIQDSKMNQTRFLIITQDNILNPKSGNDKSTIAVTLLESKKSGTLATFLNDFKENNINIIKLESQPNKTNNNFSYWFLIDFEGHFEDEQFQKIYAKYKDSIKFLGSYLKS